MMKNLTIWIVLALLVLSSGCGTVKVRSTPGTLARYYPATYFDKWKIKETARWGDVWEKVLCIPLWAIDMIPSVITDTFLLPADHGKIKRKKNSVGQ
jgi:uncharacterized protein YceK